MARSIVLLFFCLLMVTLAHAEPDETQRALIQELFPKATRIENKLSDYPVYPVYQLSQLLGYAYESKYITRLTGYSGKPIDLMIGIDVEGHFTGVHVVNHHEPVFLHGLGEEPLFEFVDQYKGRSLTEHIVVNSRKAGRDAGGDNGVVYFDGVTSATISVIIINDTILSSALKVARNKLEAFAQAPAARPKTGLYEPLTWQQMLDRQYVGHWRISLEQAEAEIGSTLDSYPEVPQPEPGEAFTEIYYAYVSAPMIGRNLLGDENFQRLTGNLKPGEQMLAVMSRGLFNHVPDDFRPGTVPGRLLLEQSDLVVELRDMSRLDSETRLIAEGIPEFEKVHLFKMGGSGGFNPGAEAQLVLTLSLPKNHLVVDRVTFKNSLQLPQELFELFLSIWDGFDIGVFLLDPVIFILWVYTFVSLKYLILVGLVGTSFYSLTLAEVEPFKASITLFFCRYLCPLGAGLAVLGRLRLFSWLERVKLCGSPCQLCKKRCEINAIRTDGRVDYDECIQCLECVVILRDDSQCVDSLIKQKQQRRGEILAVEVG